MEDINEYRKNGDNLKPFYKEKATYEKEYMIGDQGYYDQNYWKKMLYLTQKSADTILKHIILIMSLNL